MPPRGLPTLDVLSLVASSSANIGRRHRRLVADLKLTSSLASNSKGKDGEGEIRLGWKGAYVRFGNTETEQDCDHSNELNVSDAH